LDDEPEGFPWGGCDWPEPEGVAEGVEPSCPS